MNLVRSIIGIFVVAVFACNTGETKQVEESIILNENGCNRMTD